MREDRAFAFLMGGCALTFLAQWPRLARQAYLDGSELPRLVTYALLGWLMIWPLLFYFLAWVAHGISHSTGGRGSPYGARLALFWSWLAASPMALLTGVAAGFTGSTLASNAVALVWIAAFAWFWALSQNEASRGSVGNES